MYKPPVPRNKKNHASWRSTGYWLFYQLSWVALGPEREGPHSIVEIQEQSRAKTSQMASLRVN